MSHTVELPVPIDSVHVLNKNQYLVVAKQEQQEQQGTPQKKKKRGGEDSVFILERGSESDSPLPNVLKPISQDAGVTSVVRIARQGLGDFGLRMALGEQVQPLPKN